MTSLLKRSFFPFLAVSFLTLHASARQSSGAAASIDPLRVYSYCRQLANEFDGRLTGDSGYTRAALWAEEMFRWRGLKPFPESGGYLQQFPAPYSLIRSATLALTLGAETISLEPGKDFLPLFFSDHGEIDAPIVFVGWGIHAPEIGYDDYAGIDVRGKVVACFRGVPNGEDSVFSQYDEHRTRMATAKKLGALGLFYIYPRSIANPNGDRIEGFLPAMISYRIADRLLSFRGTTAGSLNDSLMHSRKPRSFPLPARVQYSVDADFHPDGKGWNVMGWIEGSDPAVKNEFVVVGAHLDHCGSHVGMTFPGANDNASGSSVVMAVAEALAAIPAPRRSVAFVLFGGEEMGLLGSTYFAAHMPKEIGRVVGMVNIDMAGEGDGATAGYSGFDAQLKRLLENADRGIGTLRNSRPILGIGVRSSDFAPFFRAGASCISFSSNGPHLAYHETGDTIYRINPDMLADIARISLNCTLALSNR